MKEKYEAVEQNKNGNKSNTVSSKINAEILEHIYPTPPEEQGPALMGPKSGLSFRFGKNDNKWDSSNIVVGKNLQLNAQKF